MNIKNLLKRIIDPNHYSSEAYIQYLRNSGVHIGEKTIVYAPRTQESVESHKNFFTLTGDDYEDVCKNFLASDPVYLSFEDFLKDCGIKLLH